MCVCVCVHVYMIDFLLVFLFYRQLLQEEEVDLTARGNGDLNTLQLAM